MLSSAGSVLIYISLHLSVQSKPKSTLKINSDFADDLLSVTIRGIHRQKVIDFNQSY